MPDHPEGLEEVQIFRYEGGDLDYEPPSSAPDNWDGDLGDLIGDYVRVSEHQAALAQARKEGREEVREALIGEDAMLAWQGGYPLTVRPENFERVFAALDSLTKEGS